MKRSFDFFPNLRLAALASESRALAIAARCSRERDRVLWTDVADKWRAVFLDPDDEEKFDRAAELNDVALGMDN